MPCVVDIETGRCLKRKSVIERTRRNVPGKFNLTHWHGVLLECPFHSRYLGTFHGPSGTRTMMSKRRSVTAWKSTPRISRVREHEESDDCLRIKPLEESKCSLYSIEAADNELNASELRYELRIINNAHFGINKLFYNSKFVRILSCKILVSLFTIVFTIVHIVIVKMAIEYQLKPIKVWFLSRA